MRINSFKVKEYIDSSSNVIITAHKDLDLDALGAVFGMFYICSNFGKRTNILLDDIENEDGVKRAIENIHKLDYNININNSKDLHIDSETLLIIVDTNNGNRIQNPKIFNEVSKKIIIDHHITNEKNDSILYEYINNEESSTCEIIIDLIIDLNIYVPEYIATVMLSGIIIDTNNFYLKTGENTFEAAAKLKAFGADINEIQHLLKQDFNKYIERQNIIMKTEFISGYAIAMGNNSLIYENEELAKSADTILLFNNVEASFAIGKIGDKEVGISARSLGEIDVQQIMKKLNGGGHKTDAATQIRDVDLDTAKSMLISVLTP